MPGLIARLSAAARAAFDQRPSSPEHFAGADARIMPTNENLQRILREFKLKSVIDDDGDLAVRWDRYSIYFFHYGPDAEVLQARLYLNHRFDVDHRQSLVMLIDDWNRSKLFPKAYTVLPDDGMVGLCAEQAFDFEGGTTAEVLRFTVGSWIQNLTSFAEWAEEQI
jgi:hypothetical protein